MVGIKDTGPRPNDQNKDASHSNRDRQREESSLPEIGASICKEVFARTEDPLRSHPCGTAHADGNVGSTYSFNRRGSTHDNRIGQGDISGHIVLEDMDHGMVYHIVTMIL